MVQSTLDMNTATTPTNSTTQARAWCAAYLAERSAGDPIAAVLRSTPDLGDVAAPIYAFVRHTHDLAHGPAPIDALSQWEDALVSAFHGRPTDPILTALLDLARTHALPITPLADLLVGVKMQQSGRALPTAETARERARATAGPLARALMHVAGNRDERALALAERFATGLRLLDDLVDLVADADAGRRTVAQADLDDFGIDLDAVASEVPAPAAAELVALLAARVRVDLCYAAPLRRRAPASLRPLIVRLHRLGMRALTGIEARAVEGL